MGEPPLQSWLDMDSDAMIHPDPADLTGTIKRELGHCPRKRCVRQLNSHLRPLYQE